VTQRGSEQSGGCLGGSPSPDEGMHTRHDARHVETTQFMKPSHYIRDIPVFEALKRETYKLVKTEFSKTYARVMQRRSEQSGGCLGGSPSPDEVMHTRHDARHVETTHFIKPSHYIRDIPVFESTKAGDLQTC
jgi:hypothetical protein